MNDEIVDNEIKSIKFLMNLTFQKFLWMINKEIKWITSMLLYFKANKNSKSTIQVF